LVLACDVVELGRRDLEKRRNCFGFHADALGDEGVLDTGAAQP
jgi:hypothetical protein